MGGTEPLLEVHVFDFDGDLYGRELDVEFVARLRDEDPFADLEALVQQMHAGCGGARAETSRRRSRMTRGDYKQTINLPRDRLSR